MARAGEAGHVGPDLSDQHAGDKVADARDGGQPLELRLKGLEVPRDLCVHISQQTLQGVDLGQKQTQLKPVMLGYRAAQPLDQPLTRRLQTPIGACQQPFRIGLPLYQSA